MHILHKLKQHANQPVSNTLWRSLQTLNIIRCLLIALALGYLIINIQDQGGYFPFVELLTLYSLLSVGFIFLTALYKTWFLPQLLLQSSLDLAIVSTIYLFPGAFKSSLFILFLFPLISLAVLAPLIIALFYASLITLILLFEGSARRLTFGNNVSIEEVGVYGAVFFLTAFMINQLAARLIKQEALAIQRGLDLKVAQSINMLVIADMREGILVLDHAGYIHASNPAAQAMLGINNTQGINLHSSPTLTPIANAFFSWLNQASKPNNTHFLTVQPEPRGQHRDVPKHLKLRFIPVPFGEDNARSLVFLQNVGEIENQAQQLKLASMGRLTASIAHEVRNPLSAISHATALLEEENASPVQSRLLHIIRDNTLRINTLIEDILKLSRKAQIPSEAIDLLQFVQSLLQERSATESIEVQFNCLPESSCPIYFDALHLREVILNLLSNAERYASGGKGSIRIVIFKKQTLEMHFWDDGRSITSEVRAHLFEPFYTTSSKGTGLGLYMARELCLNNYTHIDYELRNDFLSRKSNHPEGRFVIYFPDYSGILTSLRE